MTTLGALVWMVVAASQQTQAAVVTKTGDICVEIDTFFTDLAGDNWIVNQPRYARGVKYEITDAETTYVGFLSDQIGCLDDFAIRVEESGGTFVLKVKTIAQVNGVDIESWKGATTSTQTKQTVTWNNVATGTGTTFAVTKVVPLDQRWTNLAVATMVFRLYDWNVGQGNDRDCCLEGTLTSPDEYDLDGTCGTQAPAANEYARLTTPIQLQADTDDDGCCGSTLDDGTPGDSNDPPGLNVGNDIPYKFGIAHELGHVIGEMRTGAKEWGEYPGDVEMDGCVGDYDVNGDVFLDITRGEFTKETMAVVLRESWGNFVSTVTWNTRTEDDCEFQVIYKRHDYDLNHDPNATSSIDDERTGTALDGAYDCEGVPSLTGDPALESYVSSQNWLEDLEDADDDDDDGIQCVRDSNTVAESYHRSTVYDGLRFLWDVTTDQGIDPDVMSDVYVDMCPRGWFEGNDPSSVTDELPYTRLYLSADFHNVDTEYGNEADHLFH